MNSLLKYISLAGLLLLFASRLSAQDIPQVKTTDTTIIFFDTTIVSVDSLRALVDSLKFGQLTHEFFDDNQALLNRTYSMDMDRQYRYYKALSSSVLAIGIVVAVGGVSAGIITLAHSETVPQSGKITGYVLIPTAVFAITVPTAYLFRHLRQKAERYRVQTAYLPVNNQWSVGVASFVDQYERLNLGLGVGAAFRF